MFALTIQVLIQELNKSINYFKIYNKNENKIV